MASSSSDGSPFREGRNDGISVGGGDGEGEYLRVGAFFSSIVALAAGFLFGVSLSEYSEGDGDDDEDDDDDDEESESESESEA